MPLNQLIKTNTYHNTINIGIRYTVGCAQDGSVLYFS